MKTLQILPASGAQFARYDPPIGPDSYDLSILAWEVLIEDGKYTVTGLVARGKEIVRVTEVVGFSGYGSRGAR